MMIERLAHTETSATVRGAPSRSVNRLPRPWGAVAGMAATLALMALMALVGAARADDAVPASVPAALQPASLANARYQRLTAEPHAATLSDGQWTGAPFAPGSAVSPRVVLGRGMQAWGDLNRDGVPEAAVIVAQSTGGTGEYVHIAVLAARAGQARNVATVLLGDRVKVRDLRIEGGQLQVDVVRAGPNDPACCPAEVATLAWRLGVRGLLPVKGLPAPTRMGPQAAAGPVWVLQRWNEDEPAPAEPTVSLEVVEGRFVGRSGCNRYIAPVTVGANAGELSVARPAGTMMACPGEAMAIEQRYLQQLSQVRNMALGFRTLELGFGEGADAKTMRFTRRASGAADR
jgi:heat shock protein HslJ